MASIEMHSIMMPETTKCIHTTVNLPVELRHLRYAIVAADQGSFRRAAEVLCIRQSTLSRCICEFESLIGAKVFERSSGGIAPTLVGRRILRIAASVLEEVEVLIATATSNNNGREGRLAIGFCTSLSAGNLRATLLDFRQKFPQAELATSEISRLQLARTLRNGTLDVVITTEDPSLSGCRSLPLWSERILAILPKDHALAERETIYWTDLRNETVLLSQCDPIREIDDLLNAKLFSPADRPKVERHDVSRGIIKSLVAMRLGVSLVLESDLGVNFGTLAYKEVRDGTGSSHVGFSAHWQASNENHTLHKFLTLLAERYPSPDSLG